MEILIQAQTDKSLMSTGFNLKIPLFFTANEKEDDPLNTQTQFKIQENLLAQKKAFYAALSMPYIDEKLSLLYKQNSDSIDVLKFEKERLNFEEENDIINILLIVQELKSLKDILI